MLSLSGCCPEAAWVAAGRVAASTSVILLRFVPGKASLAVLLAASTHSLVHLMGRVLALVLSAATVVTLRVVHGLMLLLLLLTELLVTHVAGLRTRWILRGIQVGLAAAVVRVLLIELVLHD